MFRKFIRCGACVGLCPEVFELREDKAWVMGPEKCVTCNCREAVESCPGDAIRLN
ncbi:MAG: ferredoxin [Syntrophaceae bacterium]|nr:ferredoxin [Syntrophaceae bacterium]